ncbi:MAG: radical SAM protein, partial [Elusimicrobiales bacterium]|nr:radical SAM protein [Elusimicrobiales bacterium]
ETLAGSAADFGVIGEGERALLQLVGGEPPEKIAGLVRRDAASGTVRQTPPVFIDDLGSLPYPALDLYDISRYRYPHVTCRRNPVASMETSRGCFGRCVYCNKNIFGHKFRFKTPARVVDEMEHILGLGFREIHIVDDGFTTDLKRAAAICEEILRRGLSFPWYVRGGVRVDRVTPELLRLMKRAGCYRIPYGIESGDQGILNRARKGITVEQVRDAVRWARRAGMIIDGYFMIGLPGETEETIGKTLALAKELPLDYAKFALTVPLPGTVLFEEMYGKGQIKTRDWPRYNFASSPCELYSHDTLSWEELNRHYERLHREFFLRPGYIFRTALRALSEGTFLAHCRAFLGTRW